MKYCFPSIPAMLFIVFCVVLLCFFTFWVPCCDVRYDFHLKTMFGSFFYLQLFLWELMSYLRYLCLFAHSGVQHKLRYVFCFVFLRLLYPMLTGSLDCPLLIAPSVFSNVYLYS